MFFRDKRYVRKTTVHKKVIIFIAAFIMSFLLAGLMTSVQPAYRFSSDTITKWTSDIDSSIFLNLIGMENRVLLHMNDEENPFDTLSEKIFHVVTNIKPNDLRSLLGNELPGFSIYDTEILIAGEGTDYTNLPIESSFPLEDVLKDREAVYLDDEEEEIEHLEQDAPLENVVFIYNTHNRESFLPHLPEETTADRAHHGELNIMKVSERLQQELALKGIGSIVDETDIVGGVLVENNREYWQSYQASREIVKGAFAQHDDLKFSFDLHRDAIPRHLTTKNIDGQDYARVMFVIGKDNPSFEENARLASVLHDGFQEKYPGLSGGVWPQGGSGNNGVYNQDLSENALLIEVGGMENTLEEAYRTAAAIADVFSDYYWDAEAVQGNKGGN